MQGIVQKPVTKCCASECFEVLSRDRIEELHTLFWSVSRRKKDERLIGLGIPIAFPQNQPRGKASAKENDIVRKLCRLMTLRSILG